MNPQLASGIGATKEIPGEGFKRAWPPLIKMDESVKAKVEKLFRTCDKISTTGRLLVFVTPRMVA
jgi:hypothetical protein